MESARGMHSATNGRPTRKDFETKPRYTDTLTTHSYDRVLERVKEP